MCDRVWWLLKKNTTNTLHPPTAVPACLSTLLVLWLRRWLPSDSRVWGGARHIDDKKSLNNRGGNALEGAVGETRVHLFALAAGLREAAGV